MARTWDIVTDNPGKWDLIVAETGMAGATPGWRLAARGSKAPFLKHGTADILRSRPESEPIRDPKGRLREGRLSLDQSRPELSAASGFSLA